jgi:DNA-binding XRE family transcriptional regulator
MAPSIMADTEDTTPYPCDETAEARFARCFSARTKKLREAAGLSQADVAEALEIPERMYAWYEADTLLPHLLIAEWCAVVGCTITDLFEG